ncbi:MAG: branched-chain amino acid ABC transporter substrate-binding protein [Actinomycetota bacterium]|nr:branched-chain amino acid ABC transporter substrate-binding protein [Actinomycetota bacterium]
MWQSVHQVLGRLSAVAVAAAAALLVVLAVGTAGCGGGGSSSDTIKIVVEGPITGDQAATGTDMRNAARLAVDEANAQGGVLGREIELIEGDDKADPAAGRQVAEDAIDDDAFAVIGPYNSSVGVENLKLYVDAGIVPIHLTSNAATDGMGYTIQPKDYQVAPVEAKAITGYFKARRVAIVYDTSTYTAGIAKQLRNALRKAGVRVVLYESFPEGKLDAPAVVRKIQAARPDLFYASTYFPEGGRIAKEADAQEVRATCLMGLANQDPKFVESAGLDAAKRCYSSGVPAPAQFSRAGEYVADYREKFGVAPGTWGTFTYDSVKLLFSAVRAAGAWDAPRVREELSRTSDYTGITGEIDIDPQTGNRKVVPVVILDINDQGDYVVDRRWARFANFSL